MEAEGIGEGDDKGGEIDSPSSFLQSDLMLAVAHAAAAIDEQPSGAEEEHGEWEECQCNRHRRRRALRA